MNRLYLTILVVSLLQGCAASITPEDYEECVNLCGDRGVKKYLAAWAAPDCCYCEDGAFYGRIGK